MTKNRDPNPKPAKPYSGNLGRVWDGPERRHHPRPDGRFGDLAIIAHHFHEHLRSIERKVDGVFQALTEGFKTMAQELDTLKAAVARNTDVENSAVQLLQGLKTKLDAAIAAGDPAALTALSTELGTSADALAAAVVANTPAA